MSWRIHTASPEWTDVQTYTEAELGKEFGYDYTEDEAENEVLVLFDSGNQEAWVFDGDSNGLARIAQRMLANTDGLDKLRDVTYEKCLVCHLFVEPNDAFEDAPLDTARYMHLCNDDYDTDEALDASHEPHPSGVVLPLWVWKAYGPAPMRAMFGRT